MSQEHKYIKKLKKITKITVADPNLIYLSTNKIEVPDKETDLLSAFFILQDAILELSDRIKTIEDHAAGHEDI